jgi:hypothetical protein
MPTQRRPTNNQMPSRVGTSLDCPVWMPSGQDGGVPEMHPEYPSSDPVPGSSLPPRPRRGWWLIAVASAVVVIVVGGGFGWPGWWRGTTPPTLSNLAPPGSPCALLSPDAVGLAIGITRLVVQDRGTHYDPETGTPIRLCTYATNGVVQADITTAPHPADRVPGGAAGLARNAATTAARTQPATVPGADAALWATDLGHTRNRALITVHTSGATLNLLIVAIDQATNPTDSAVERLVDIALRNQ